MGVDGVDVLTLSAEFVNEYLNDNLRAQLRGHGPGRPGAVKRPSRFPM
jgi:hypothetical protein